MSRTDKQIAAGQLRSLRAMRAKLLTMSGEWEDLDQSNVAFLEELADQVEQVSLALLPDPSSAELGDLS